MISVILNAPAFWGFAGAAVYASTVLAKQLWGPSPAEGNARKLALAQFGIAMFFGPVAAAGFTPSLSAWFPKLDAHAISLTIGLSANYIWPLVVKALGIVTVKGIRDIAP
jgi:hypothetical protein